MPRRHRTTRTATPRPRVNREPDVSDRVPIVPRRPQPDAPAPRATWPEASLPRRCAGQCGTRRSSVPAAGFRRPAALGSPSLAAAAEWTPPDEEQTAPWRSCARSYPLTCQRTAAWARELPAPEVGPHRVRRSRARRLYGVGARAPDRGARRTRIYYPAPTDVDAGATRRR